VASDGSALAIAAPPVAVPELPEFDAAERVRAEFQSTGLWFSAHPLEVWLDDAAARGTCPAAELPARVGRRVTVAGLPCARRGVTTKQGEPMLFLTLADRSGLAECVLFPDAYRTWAAATRGAIVRVEGRVDETLDAVTVTAERIRSLV
jgi:DNA polymerase III alpha subunit